MTLYKLKYTEWKVEYRFKFEHAFVENIHTQKRNVKFLYALVLSYASFLQM